VKGKQKTERKRTNTHEITTQRTH